MTSTNDSYRAIAIERGGKRPEDVTVVRTGPDPARLRAGEPDPALRRGRDHLAVYLGVMGPQDGVDLAVRAVDHLVHELGRTDVSFTFIGSGESYDELVALVRQLGVDEYVDLPGACPTRTWPASCRRRTSGCVPIPRTP